MAANGIKLLSSQFIFSLCVEMELLSYQFIFSLVVYEASVSIEVSLITINCMYSSMEHNHTSNLRLISVSVSKSINTVCNPQQPMAIAETVHCQPVNSFILLCAIWHVSQEITL